MTGDIIKIDELVNVHKNTGIYLSLEYSDKHVTLLVVEDLDNYAKKAHWIPQGKIDIRDIKDNSFPENKNFVVKLKLNPVRLKSVTEILRGKLRDVQGKRIPLGFELYGDFEPKNDEPYTDIDGKEAGMTCAIFVYQALKLAGFRLVKIKSWESIDEDDQKTLDGFIDIAKSCDKNFSEEDEQRVRKKLDDFKNLQRLSAQDAFIAGYTGKYPCTQKDVNAISLETLRKMKEPLPAQPHTPDVVEHTQAPIDTELDE